MKKTASILLMCLLLFNWFGYKLVLNYLQQEGDLRLEARIDVNDYNESDLVEMRVALNMPYQSAWTDFERHYGEIEIDGKHYTYVKRKIDAGYLVLKCIANPQKDQIKNTGDAIFKAANNIDTETGKSPAPSKAVKQMSIDFDNDRYSLQLHVLKMPLQKYFTCAQYFVHHDFATTNEQPPEASPFLI